MIPKPSQRIRLAAALALAATALCAPTPSAGADLDYALDLPASRTVAFEIEFEVAHPGPLSIVADWDSTRVLSFKLDGAEGAASARRSGPPPQRIELKVDPHMASSGEPWKLSIRGLPGGASRGTVRFSLPEPEPLVKPVPKEPPPPVVVEPEPAWMVPRKTPVDAAAEVARLYEATERLRSHVAATDGAARDRYVWQERLLEYVSTQRDAGATIDPRMLELLVRTVEVTRGVQHLATTNDPLIAGPPPTEVERRKAWLLVRAERIKPVESELDLLLYDVTRRDSRLGAPPEWLPRLVSSLMACERHFEQRGRLGDAKASHAEVVAEQWDGLRLAADALDSLIQAVPVD